MRKTKHKNNLWDSAVAISMSVLVCHSAVALVTDNDAHVALHPLQLSHWYNVTTVIICGIEEETLDLPSLSCTLVMASKASVLKGTAGLAK